MFLLMAEVLRFREVAKAFPGNRLWEFLGTHQSHVDWLGCHLHDLTQPSFLQDWTRHTAKPVVPVRKGGYDEQFASDPKVFRDGDHWTIFYFGVGKGGAHIMIAFSRDLLHWTAHPEPLYKAGGNPSGHDKQYEHKISLVYNPADDTYYLYYCACGKDGRGIGLITSKPVASGR
ncbi:MAG: hypothetical protein HZB26_10765 [Candidatus Hydrogenedentes bacterium]|nr:hypothetical protein [Candidatus Hydrogenedentota bacterium]